jgi:crotonobetainyl-CoA:carnitine CoA-transferase CaiB-like acyl-CoA transferase
MAGVLEGIRVVDFGRYIAGPFCATLLGDLGADVIRVERVDGGEDRFVTPVTDDGVGTMFLQVGRNKRSLTLNLTKPEGREVVERLIRTADVVVANLPPQTLVGMGLDYESLKAIKPDIILTTANAFGSGGPISSKIGFDGLAQSMSGNLHVSGHPDEPMRASVAYVDFGTAAFSAFATMAALRHRDQTGEGQVIEGALLKTALTISNSHLMEQDLLKLDRVASGNRAQTAGPSDVHATADGWIMCMVIGSYQFERWTEMVGRPELFHDERFKDDLARGDNGEALSAIMSAWCATGVLAAAGVGRRAHQGHRHPGRCRVSDVVQAGQGRRLPGVDERLARPHPSPCAHDRRAHRRGARRTGLLARGDHVAPRRPYRLIGVGTHQRRRRARDPPRLWWRWS